MVRACIAPSQLLFLATVTITHDGEGMIEGAAGGKCCRAASATVDSPKMSCRNLALI